MKTQTTQLSKTTVAVVSLALLGGILLGLQIYLQRSPNPEEHAAGSSAIGVHIVLAVM